MTAAVEAALIEAAATGEADAEELALALVLGVATRLSESFERRGEAPPFWLVGLDDAAAEAELAGAAAARVAEEIARLLAGDCGVRLF